MADAFGDLQCCEREVPDLKIFAPVDALYLTQPGDTHPMIPSTYSTTDCAKSIQDDVFSNVHGEGILN